MIYVSEFPFPFDFYLHFGDPCFAKTVSFDKLLVERVAKLRSFRF